MAVAGVARLESFFSRPRRRSLLFGTAVMSFLLTLLLLLMPAAVSAHGYLKTPRSRNLVAYQDKNYEMPEENDPKPEDCPHCLNRGGQLAQCGILYGTLEGTPWERNYDQPLSVWGEPMSPNLQGVYEEGGVIDIEVLVTTHHKGHFEFAACPIDATQVPMPIPTEECFQNNKLTFLSDELYGAPPDPNFPERAYIAPASKVEWLNGSPGEQPVVGAEYKMKFQLPEGLAGDLVLIQWYYLTANSCKHEGYADYPFPDAWGSDVELYPGLDDCGEVPPDGNGVPEQFWNCAEIKVVGPGGKTTPLSTPVADEDEVKQVGAMEIAQLKIDLVEDNAPAQHPVPHKQCADASYSYYEATEDCTSYIYCTMGTPDKPYSCGNGMLYDEPGQRCNWADKVSCNGNNKLGNSGVAGGDETADWMPTTPRPTNVPTPSPTRPPNPLLHWDPITSADRGHDKTMIGYYASWQWYDRDGVAAPINMDFSKITRANFAFFQITPQGDIYGTDSWADPITLFGFFDWMAEDGPLYCSWDGPGGGDEIKCSAHKYEEGLIYLAHQAGAEVYPSIGGWSLSDPFPAMAASETARARFASQCVDLIKNYNFDGIDLDWEYPGYEDHSGTPEDTVNFNLLLDDVRAALDELETETGKYYGLTAALPCGPTIIDNQDIAHVASVLTELNLMTYDFHGSWNPKTGVNAPLYDQNGSPDFSVHGCVANWLAGGATKEKINIGFPFYGRSFLRAEHLYESHEGNDETTWHMDEGVPQYYNIMDKMNEYTSVRDDQTMTQYMFGETGMVSYDDERAICDKTEYAQVHDLNGYIIWELSGDLMPDLSTPLLDAANAKLLDLTMDCATLDHSDHTADIFMIEGKLGEDDNAVDEIIYYPDFSGGICLHDGLHSEWLRPDDKFDSAESCCGHNFSWNEDCVKDTEGDVVVNLDVHTVGGLYYPSSSAHECLSDGRQPEWQMESVFDSIEECCESYYGWSPDCIANSFAKATPNIATVTAATISTNSLSSDTSESFTRPTSALISESDEVGIPDVVPTHPAAAPTVLAMNTDPVDEVGYGVFYPVFKDGTTTCQNVGAPPSWMTGNYLKETKSECCQNFAFPWNYDECLKRDSHAFAPGHYSRSYYPNYRKKSCVHDDNHPSWMAGDYLSHSDWQCCSNNFHSEELLGQCQSMPACADCVSDMNNYDGADTTAAADFLASIDTTDISAAAAAAIDKTDTAAAAIDTTDIAAAAEPTIQATMPLTSFVTTTTTVTTAVESVLEAHKESIDSEILVYEAPTMEWLPSSVYRYQDFLAALRVMYTEGIADKYFYMGDDSQNGYIYGLVNIAAFLAQSMKETIKYNACDENSWDLVGGGYPLSNACGQLGQSYQDYECAAHEKHMECPVKKDMTITATTNAKWWGAPAPLSCGPKELYPFTGYWDHSVDCNNVWVDPPQYCTDYEGQKGGTFNNESPSPNASGRTDVEGCCWWGRGVIQSTGVCNFGKLNYYLGAGAAEDGRDSRYPDVNFCETPDAICASEEHKELKWISGMFYWVESLQSYNVGGWNYINELKRFVDNGLSGNSFIDAVSGIVNRGCHNPPCASGGVDGSFERSSNFIKVLAELDLVQAT